MPKIAANQKTAKAKPGRSASRGTGGFSVLEKNILMSKGLTEAQIRTMIKKGIRCRDDFKQVGDAGTLTTLADVPPEAAAAVMSWALGAPVQISKNVIVESGDVVHCVHCGTKQPKDYKSGDLCGSCGKQAEPIMACFWCASTGPGKFCRQCAAEFVPTGELELAILLRREGLAKDEIPEKLRGMNPEEKIVLWGRARKYAR